MVVSTSFDRVILLTCRLFLLSLVVRVGRSSTVTNTIDDEEEVLNAQCKKLCKNYYDNELKTSICNEALNLMPRPGVYKACLNGLFVGFEHSCMPTCTGKSYEGGGKIEITPGDSYVACKSEWNRSRPNNQLPWCRKGYDATYDIVKKDMKEKLMKNKYHSFSQNNDNNHNNGMEQISTTTTTKEDETLEEEIMDKNHYEVMKQNENEQNYDESNMNKMDEQVKEKEIELFLEQNDLSNQEESGYGSVGISIPDKLAPLDSTMNHDDDDNNNDDKKTEETIQQIKESNLRSTSYSIDDENDEAPPNVVISSTFHTDVKASNTTEL